MSRPIIGILMLDHNLTRPPGDPGNPSTFSFPVLYKTIRGASLERLLLKDASLLQPMVEAGQELFDRGAAAIASGCGFFIYFQHEMAARLKIPVTLSSLMQIPFVQRTLGPTKRIGILTAHKGRLTREHLLRAGMEPTIPAKVVGMENEPYFRQAVLEERGRLEFDKVQAEVVIKARELAAPDEDHRPVGAIVLECTNLPPYAAAVQEAVRLPVYDVTTMIEHLHSALVRRRFTGQGQSIA